MTVSQFVLRPATPQEVHYVHDLNAASWAGDLTIETYHAREQTLASTALTKNGGLGAWVLVNPANDPHKVLSSCETIKKDALVSKPPINGDIVSTVKSVTAHGVGSVFTPADQRGKGYARIMLRLLSEMLKKGNPEGFSVLYSDIGKKFYARCGWLPHRSSHLEFPALGAGTPPLTGVKHLRSSDVPSLCVKDLASLKESLLRPLINHKTRIAFVPDYRTLEWHWAREEFVAPVLRKHVDIKPEIKGAITLDEKRWMIWNRDFGASSSQLFIIRYVNQSCSLDEEEEEEQIANLFRAAGLEAKKWGLQKVTMWNPDDISIRAARRASGSGVSVVDRETDSICSLMMHPNGQGSGLEEVDWLVNEKFSWC